MVVDSNGSGRPPACVDASSPFNRKSKIENRESEHPAARCYHNPPMPTTDEIIAKAKELGKLIASHPAAAKFEETIKKIQGDVEAQRALNDFNRLLQKIGEKEQTGQPIEPE